SPHRVAVSRGPWPALYRPRRLATRRRAGRKAPGSSALRGGPSPSSGRAASRDRLPSIGLPHGEDGARREADHAIRDAAEQGAIEPGAPVRPHDDQLRPLVPGELDDGLLGGPRQYHGAHRRPPRGRRPLLELVLHPLPPLLEELPRRAGGDRRVAIEDGLDVD